MKKKIIALLILAAMCVPAGALAAPADDAAETETTIVTEDTKEQNSEERDRDEDRDDNDDRDHDEDRDDDDDRDHDEDRDDDDDRDHDEDRDDHDDHDDHDDQDDDHDRDDKEAERLKKEAEQAEKKAEKEAEQAEKKAEKEAEQAEKKAEKEAEQAEKEAKEAAKIQAKEEVRRLKEEHRQAEIEAGECLRSIKEFFKYADVETRNEILAQIAELKTELEENSIGIFVRGIDIDFSRYDNVEPVIENERTLVPLRAVVEALDSNVSWEAETKTITINNDDISIVMQIGSNIAVVNGVEKELDAAPVITKDRTMVPLRFIAEAMQSEVEWDDTSRTIVID